jgi:hypothetical protein
VNERILVEAAIFACARPIRASVCVRGSQLAATSAQERARLVRLRPGAPALRDVGYGVDTSGG